MCPPTVFGLMKSCSAIWSSALAPREETQGPRFRARSGRHPSPPPQAPREAQTAARCVEGPRGPREQLIVVERFHDVVVGADEEPGNLGPRASSSRARRR